MTIFNFKPKKKLIHASIDIETLSLQYDAVITEIAVTLFDENTIGDTTEWLIDWTKQKQRHIDPSTLLWAMHRPLVIERLHNMKDRIYLTDALHALRKTLHGVKYVWAKSPTFDCAVLKNAYDNETPPWDFRLERDVRTLMEVKNLSYTNLPFSNEASHTAAGDALFQARIIQLAI